MTVFFLWLCFSRGLMTVQKFLAKTGISFNTSDRLLLRRSTMLPPPIVSIALPGPKSSLRQRNSGRWCSKNSCKNSHQKRIISFPLLWNTSIIPISNILGRYCHLLLLVGVLTFGRHGLLCLHVFPVPSKQLVL